MTQLPERKLADIVEFKRGLTYSKRDEVSRSESVVLRATNIDLNTNLLDFSDLRYIRDSVPVPESKRIRRDSLLICTASGSKSHLGKVALIDSDLPYAFGGFMGMITPKNEVVPRYLFHVMTSGAYKDFIDGLSDGANINNLKFDDLGKFAVPLPKTPEQRRIVAILDKAFESIAIARASAEKNLQNARELFRANLHSVFSGSNRDWAQSTIGAVCTLRSGSTLPPRIERAAGEIPYLKVADMNLTDNSDGVTTSSRFVNKADVSANNFLPAGTTIFPKRGGAILTNKKRITRRPICADLNIMGVIPKPGLLPEFLFYFFQQLDLREINSGSSIPQINNYNIEPLVISFPKSIELQQAIVDRLTQLSAQTKRLESIYERKLAALDELKQSLLHQAFSGQL